MPTREEIIASLSPEDEQAITTALNNWIEAGVEAPRIILGYDADEDGALDAWAFDEAGRLTLVNVDSVDETVYSSEGDGTEQGGVHTEEVE